MTQKWNWLNALGINQADISKLENGTRNPSVNLLKRLADGMGMALKIEFVSKTESLIFDFMKSCFGGFFVKSFSC